jgi:type II secretory pathway component PulM
VDAVFELKGSRTVAQLEALRTRVLGQLNTIKIVDYDACATLSGSAKQPMLTFSLRFHSLMSQEAQLASLTAFMTALSPFAEVKGLDVSLLATSGMLH